VLKVDHHHSRLLVKGNPQSSNQADALSSIPASLTDRALAFIPAFDFDPSLTGALYLAGRPVHEGICNRGVQSDGTKDRFQIRK
jgi:hypothetical protein